MSNGGKLTAPPNSPAVLASNATLPYSSSEPKILLTWGRDLRVSAQMSDAVLTSRRPRDCSSAIKAGPTTDADQSDPRKHFAHCRKKEGYHQLRVEDSPPRLERRQCWP